VDVVSALEVLEHLPAAALPKAVAEIARITRGWVFATIPSLGRNDNGTDGFASGKVRPERLAPSDGLGPDYDGPVPDADLAVDATGQPVEGHLTIASFRWWTARFEGAGLVRCPEVERRVNDDLDRFGLAGLWNPYVFRLPDVPVPEGPVPSDEARAERETLWHLDEWAPLHQRRG
jgi:hypothetical protein